MPAGTSVASHSLKAPLPANEAARIRALHEYAILEPVPAGAGR
jgi:hypothetical protein